MKLRLFVRLGFKKLDGFGRRANFIEKFFLKRRYHYCTTFIKNNGVWTAYSIYDKKFVKLS